MHASSTPPAFVLSQDQTLTFEKLFKASPHVTSTRKGCPGLLLLNEQHNCRSLSTCHWNNRVGVYTLKHGTLLYSILKEQSPGPGNGQKRRSTRAPSTIRCYDRCFSGPGHMLPFRVIEEALFLAVFRQIEYPCCERVSRGFFALFSISFRPHHFFPLRN